MYTLRLVVHPLLGSLHLSGALAVEDDNGEWSTLATFSEVLPMDDVALSEDPVATMIGAIGEWSVRTIQE
jgi:hypothetical protein